MPWILLSASGTKVASENENVYTEEKLEKIDGMGAVLVFSELGRVYFPNFFLDPAIVGLL